MSKRIPSHCPVCSTKLNDETGSTSESIRCEGCGGLVILKADVAAVNPTSKRTVPRIGTLGRFELKEILGEGAFGRVYRAFDPLLERDVALKVPTFSSSDQQRVARFSREAKTAAKLRHPNIVPTFETGKADGKFFIVSQYIVGQTGDRNMLSTIVEHFVVNLVRKND